VIRADYRALGLTAALLALLGTTGAVRAADADAAKPAKKEAAKPRTVDPDYIKVIQGINEAYGKTADKAVFAQQAIDKLNSYASSHKKAPEALQAQMTIASLYSDFLDKPEKAMDLLRQVAKKADNADLRMIAQLNIADIQTKAERFNDAEATLKAIKVEKDSPQAKMVEGKLRGIAGERALSAGKTPPTFSEKDLSGVERSPESFKGKVLMIDFWASWCGPCRGEMPNVKAAYGKYHDKGFEILGVSLDQKLEDAQKYLTDEKIEWPQIVDGKFWEAKVAKLYGVQAIPRTILLDREGKIRFKDLRGEALDKAVAKLVDEK
jgi:thiol-disulfide isomerase/thioredoxin/cell fate (sporulation/competence/biofilm development) regulator YmcA (YheA/YmcA/DUF963 family)